MHVNAGQCPQDPACLADLKCVILGGQVPDFAPICGCPWTHGLPLCYHSKLLVSELAANQSEQRIDQGIEGSALQTENKHCQEVSKMQPMYFSTDRFPLMETRGTSHALNAIALISTWIDTIITFINKIHTYLDITANQ